MSSSIFIFGRTPAISALELAVFTEFIEPVSGVAVAENFSGDEQELINKLGGTVKISRLVAKVPDLSAESLLDVCTQLVKNNQFTFGVSVYGDKNQVSRAFLRELKSLVGQTGVSVRFIENIQNEPLSSVVVAKQKVTEIILVRQDSEYLVGRTVAVQPFSEWNRRDYDRPMVDPKSGMLPPKVARMLVNIALPENPSVATLLDPFCGMGTILAEGLLAGFGQVVGIDQSESAVAATVKNLDWLVSKYRYIDTSKRKEMLGDATHVSDSLPENSIDAIVTEPYMGPVYDSGQVPDNEKLKNIVRGLEKLYLGCLKDWLSVLKAGAMVVMAMPKLVVRGREFSVKKVIDRCESLGYTTQAGPIEYSRPQAVVKREFYILKKR